MQTMTSVLPLVALLAPLAALPGIVSAKGPNMREAWSFAAAFGLFAVVLSILPMVQAGEQPGFFIAPVIPGAPLALRVDAAGMLFAIVASLLWIVTTGYAIGYTRNLKKASQTRFYAYFAMSLSATIGVAFSANLLTMYLFYELLSFSTYPLVTHQQDEDSAKAGRKYLGYIVGTSIGLALPAVIATHALSGDLGFGGAPMLAGVAEPTVAAALLLLFLFGFAKAALMPVHGWLPAAMVAPTPVSALLHAVAVVKVGGFCIVRVVTEVFGVDLLADMNLGSVVVVLAGITMIVASLIALSQDGLKRRLAYSTVGQLAYIALGVGLLTPLGIVGGVLHIAMHAFGKITLFFCAGAIYVATGEKYISKMGGIGRRMPWTMLAFFIGSLSIIGVPPTGGFLSKWHLLLGSLQADQWIVIVVLLVSSLLNASYFLPLVYKAWFAPHDEASHTGPVREAPLWCLVPPLVTAAISVAVFIYPDPLLNLARMVAGL
jgi:multicomponent Na+:H+ antiporter subunit D